MSRYKRRIIGVSIFIHLMALVALFFYWLLKDPVKEKQNQTRLFDKPASTTAEAQAAEGDKAETEAEPEEKDKGAVVDKRKDKDFFKDQLKQAQSKADKMTLKEKNEALNDNLAKISKINIHEVKKITDVIEKMAGADGAKRSSNPNHERKMGEAIDVASLRLYDYEVTGEKYVLVWRDKNNVVIKDSPVKRGEIEDHIWMRMKLAKKARENKKFEMLLNAVENITDKISTQ